MFINKDRIEEDLELSRRVFEHSMGKPQPDERESRIDDSAPDFTFSEVMSLISAAFWVVLPWALAFAVLLGIVGWAATIWLR